MPPGEAVYVQRSSEHDRVSFQDRLAALGYSSYGAYLRSSHWRGVRGRYERSKLPQHCYLCGAEKFQLHQRSYARLGNERLTDLLPLCQPCHNEVHDYLREHRSKRVRLWTAARVLRKKNRKRSR
jgi:hypothetical protein